MKVNKKQINPTRYFRERNSGYGLILRLVSRFQEGCAKTKNHKKRGTIVFFFFGKKKREKVEKHGVEISLKKIIFFSLDLKIWF